MTTKHTPGLVVGKHNESGHDAARCVKCRTLCTIKVLDHGYCSLCLESIRAAAPDLLAALRFQASWTMRDGTPCACPAGRNECEPSGRMPTVHATSCEMLRAAIAKAE